MSARPAGDSVFVVLRLSSFGDVVLAEPVTRRLKQAYPGCRVEFATYEEYGEIPTLFPGVDAIITYSRATPPRPTVERATAGRVAALVDLQNNARSRLVAAGIPAARVLRYRRPYVRRFLAVYLPKVWRGNLRHTIDLYLDAVRPLGIAASADFPQLAVPAECLDEARARLGDGPSIGICPGASNPYKMWATDRFNTLASRLAAQGHRVVAIGSGRDREAVKATTSGLAGPRVSSYIADSARELAAVLSLCAVTVSNDSGLLHLAAGVGSKVVSICGPTSPLLGFAVRSPGSVVVSRGLACSPCSYHGNRPCKHERMACFEDIQPAEVAAIVNDVAGPRG
ncbi:MAG TPA: glycosyltransferase family 9 protein [bacterium]|nr:glycosyltransferase family 9 protein [bacterium]